MTDPDVPAGAGRPRLVITKLELENFKSYAGVQHIGPFHKSLSAIVGPNGSGKSNVIDAMLFVFGRRAKQLRLSKVSELIHNSTDHQNLKSARVSVFFEEVLDTGPDEYEKVEGSDLVVSRTANKNNTSDYFVNGKKSSFTEVTTLLKAKGVDLDNNRFLILQGEVELISQMPPKAEKEGGEGMLEYLEDIIGTNKYIEDIKAAGTKLEELSEEKQKQIQRVKTAEKSRDQLKDSKDLAERYRSQEIEFLEKTVTLLRYYKGVCQHNVEEVQSQIQELNKKLEHEKATVATFEEEVAKLKSEAESADKGKAALVKKYEVATKKVKELERQATTAKEREAHLQKKLATARSAVASTTKKQADLTKQMEIATEELPDAEAAVTELRSDMQEATTKLSDMQQDVQGEVHEVNSRLTKARTALAPWHDKMQAIRNERQLVADQAERLSKEASAATTRRAATAADLERATQDLQEAQACVAGMEDKQAMHREEAVSATKLAKEAQQNVAKAEQAVADAKGLHMSLAAALDETRNKGRALKGLLEAQERGQLKGLYGRLGDLGSIDKQYDAAVSNATGTLDNLVIDTTVHAQQCVEHLRKHDLGVATFLILEKQAHLARHVDTKVQTPEGIPRLFDLVKCNRPELRPAFFFAFRHTLVANDIDQASRIGHGSKDPRFSRVVTMQGELVSENGTMSGGGTRVTRGKMRLGSAAPAVVDPATSRAELVAAEEQVQKLDAELQEYRHAAAENAQRADAAVKAQENAAMEFQKSCLAVQSGTRKCRELKLQLQELDASMTDNAAAEAEIAKLTEVIGKHDTDLERVQQDAAGAEELLSKVQAELEAVGGEPLRQQKDRVETLKQDLKEAEQILAKQKTMIKSATKSLKKLTTDLQNKQREIESFEADLNLLLERQDGSGNEAEVLKQQQQELQQEIKEVRAELDDKQVQIQAKQGELRQIKAVQTNINEAISERQAMADEECSKAQELEQKIVVSSENLAGILPDGQLPNLASNEQVSQMTDADAKEIELSCSVLEGTMQELQKKDVDLTAIEKFAEKDQEYNLRKEELDRVTEQRTVARDAYESLRKRRQDEFSAGFKIISDQLKDMYEMITNGGNAELEMVDSMDPFAEGIIFSVRPPKKSWKNITQLSGGEKTLSSLALVFALHHFKPTPLYFMDEIDAALDFKNVSIVAHYVKEQTKHAQFVVISLRNHMFELADHLVGIYKTNNCTKNVTIEPSQFVVKKSEERPVLQQQRA